MHLKSLSIAAVELRWHQSREHLLYSNALKAFLCQAELLGEKRKIVDNTSPQEAIGDTADEVVSSGSVDGQDDDDEGGEDSG